MRQSKDTMKRLCAVGCVMAVTGVLLQAQVPAPIRPGVPGPAAEVAPPADYVIGPEDVLQVVVWDEQAMSADVIVRPDGMITLPLMNDIQAAGLTPEQLRVKVTEAALKFKEGASVMVRVKEIKSRMVTIVGQVAKVGAVPIGGPMTVLQLIGAAGGLLDFAKAKNILILRVENGQQKTFKFNYNEVSKGQKLPQNILLKPGDTVMVP